MVHVKKRKDEFLDILKTHTQAREYDEILIHYWLLQYKGIKSDEITLAKFLTLTKTNNLPSMETFARLRRQVQQDHPEVSGNRRTKEAEEEVKIQLGYAPSSGSVA